MDVSKWPRHPQTPPDEQEARAHPQQYYEHQRSHEPLPCDEVQPATKLTYPCVLRKTHPLFPGPELEPSAELMSQRELEPVSYWVGFVCVSDELILGAAAGVQSGPGRSERHY
jgi:hypothetical protein